MNGKWIITIHFVNGTNSKLIDAKLMAYSSEASTIAYFLHYLYHFLQRMPSTTLFVESRNRRFSIFFFYQWWIRISKLVQKNTQLRRKWWKTSDNQYVLSNWMYFVVQAQTMLIIDHSLLSIPRFIIECSDD